MAGVNKELQIANDSEVKSRIIKYLEAIAVKEGLNVEVQFTEKKIIPGINYASVCRKKRILELPSSIIGRLEEDEIKASGLHEIGHIVGRGFLLRMANFVVVAMVVGLAMFYSVNRLLYHLFGISWGLLILLDLIDALAAYYVGCYSISWWENKADKYATDIIGKVAIINSLTKLNEWAREQMEFRKWGRRIFWKLSPMHPSINSRKRFLEKYC